MVLPHHFIDLKSLHAWDCWIFSWVDSNTEFMALRLNLCTCWVISFFCRRWRSRIWTSGRTFAVLVLGRTPGNIRTSSAPRWTKLLMPRDNKQSGLHCSVKTPLLRPKYTHDAPGLLFGLALCSPRVVTHSGLKVVRSTPQDLQNLQISLRLAWNQNVWGFKVPPHHVYA